MTSILPSTRTEGIEYAIRDVVLLAEKLRQQGREIRPLNIGDPCQFDFKTPGRVIRAISVALMNNFTAYCPSSGVPDAIEMIRIDALSRGMKSVGEIFITFGASEAIEIGMTALLNEYENILMPSPGYPLYSAIASKIRAEARPYFLDEENDWQPDLADIESKIDDRTRAIVLINPNNPTGSVCKRETLLELLEIARKNNLVVFADEVYDKLVFDRIHIPLASLADDVAIVSLGSLSKNYLAPGLRVGWGIIHGPNELVSNYSDAVLKMTRSRLCSNHAGHYGIIAALAGDNEHVIDAVSRLKKQRDLSMKRLNAIPGISCVTPNGAFYAFPKIDTLRDDADVIRELLIETGIVLVHGSGFGQKPGTHHFRMVFLPNEEILNNIFDDIERVLPRLL